MFIATEAALFGDDGRLLLLPALQERAVAAAGDRRSPKVVVPLVLAGVLVADERADALLGARGARRPAAPRVGSCSLALLRAGGLLRDRRCIDYADDLRQLHAAAATRTARSTTRCSAPTTRTSRSGCCSTCGCSCKLARGLTPYRLKAVRAIALYWYVVSVLTVVVVVTVLLARRMSVRRLSLLQWIGLLVGGRVCVGRPAPRAASASRRRLQRRRRRAGAIPHDRGERRDRRVAVLADRRRGVAAIVVCRATRDVEDAGRAAAGPHPLLRTAASSRTSSSS